MKILLFEDDPQLAPLLERQLAATVEHGSQVVRFAAANADDNGMHRKRLEREITDQGHQDASLIVADLDLSGLDKYRGLSEPIVREVADKLGIPECSYARGQAVRYGIVTGENAREGRISVSLQDGNDKFVEKVISIAKSFESIRENLPTALLAKGRKSAGRVLATLLARPDYAEKIALYASGDQNRLESVLRVRGDDGDKHRWLACLLGYWLWDSVLFYPGVVANEVAASSYLNIEEEAFKSVDVRALFQDAIYQGPFSKTIGPLWWRPVLDDIIASSNQADGRAFAKDRLGKEIPQSKCVEDPNVPASHYCMISGKPVSLANSIAGLTWFPRGADLARISKTKYAEIVPWL